MSFHSLGYVQHWLVAGPHQTPYTGPSGDENVLRRVALDQTRPHPPAHAVLGHTGPTGQPWRFHYPGENLYVEYSAFFSLLTLIDLYAFTQIEAEEDGIRQTRLWVAGAADLWINDEHTARVDVTRYMYPDFKPIAVSVRKGINRIAVRLQCLGVRDTRVLFGLQLLDTHGLAVRVPASRHLIDAANWLDGVRVESPHRLTSKCPPPAPVRVTLSNKSSIQWPAQSSDVSLGSTQPFQMHVEVNAEGQVLRRVAEIAVNRRVGQSQINADRSIRLLEKVASWIDMPGEFVGNRTPHLVLLARRLLGRRSDADRPAFAKVIACVDRRDDCADFSLATLLRLASLKLADADESTEIARAACAFRYWNDEPGTDAMCFWSENHSLLFHGCQLIAGNLYPDAIFANSSRSGREQAAIGAARCREWLDRTERRGFEEFNSSTYLPVTVAALLNVVDFSGDVELSRRAAALIDQIHELLAKHAFGGIVIAPQGRVYRNVLWPEESGSRAMLACATRQAPLAIPPSADGRPPSSWTGDYCIYLASSPSYRAPADLDRWITEPIQQRYRQADAEIVLHKTPAYILTSLAIPATAADGESKGLQPGRAGYQQHLWQATLGPGCHIFVNHPGCSVDDEKSRPGYWNGNGVLPLLRQKGNTLLAIFNIPDGTEPAAARTPAEYAWPPGGTRWPFDLHPISFTHAHWPTDAFDEQHRHGKWVFGRKADGLIGLWCSEPLVPHDDVLSGRELRAWGCRCGWVCVCGSLEEHGSFDAFVEVCIARGPVFDREGLSLRVAGEEALVFAP